MPAVTATKQAKKVKSKKKKIFSTDSSNEILMIFTYLQAKLERV